MNHRGAEAPRKPRVVHRHEYDPITRQIIGGAIEVHRALGPGLLESVYEECLAVELTERGLGVQRQAPVPVVYKGRNLDCGYRVDMVVSSRIVVELKAVDKILPVHEAQLLSYLRLTGMTVGLLINFHTPILKDGIVRRIL